MKTFWIIVVLVVALAGGAWFLRSNKSPKSIPVGEVTRIEAPTGGQRPAEPRPAPSAASTPAASTPVAQPSSQVTPAQPAQPPAKPVDPAVRQLGDAPIETISKPALPASQPIVTAPPTPAPATAPAAAAPADAKPSIPTLTSSGDLGMPVQTSGDLKMPTVDPTIKPSEEKKPTTTPAEPKPADASKPVDATPPAASPATAIKSAEPPPAPAPSPATPSSDEASKTTPALADPATTDASKAEPAAQPPAPPADASKPAPAGGAGAADAKPTHIVDDQPAVIEPREDGSMLLDGKYIVKGEGTVEKPYEVTWEMLLSAEETYQPKQGMRVIPGRLAMLDGKHVRVTGYIAFPLYVQEARELLSMLNQWDGCCIGVPPTPYDAIEVRLKEAVGEQDRFATFGSVEGLFGVKPYVVGDWLVGLYTMDNAKFNAKQFGGFGS